jgi:hypothetical protein
MALKLWLSAGAFVALTTHLVFKRYAFGIVIDVIHVTFKVKIILLYFQYNCEQNRYLFEFKGSFDHLNTFLVRNILIRMHCTTFDIVHLQL